MRSDAVISRTAGRTVLSSPASSSIDYCWNRWALIWRLKEQRVVSGVPRAAGRLFHVRGPLMAKLRWTVAVRARGTSRVPDAVERSIVLSSIALLKACTGVVPVTDAHFWSRLSLLGRPLAAYLLLISAHYEGVRCRSHTFAVCRPRPRQIAIWTKCVIQCYPFVGLDHK